MSGLANVASAFHTVQMNVWAKFAANRVTDMARKKRMLEKAAINAMGSQNFVQN
jgi:hypothetical protein